MKRLKDNEIEFTNIYNVAHEFMVLVEDNYNPDVIKVTNHLPSTLFLLMVSLQ